MNEQYRTQDRPEQGITYYRRSSGRGALYTAIGAAVLAGAGLVTALVLGLGGPTTASAADNTPPPAPAHSQVQPANGSGSSSQAPSDAVRSLQQQLGDLNYYEGPVDGVMNAQTTQAITYLQRDAHLPQTGQLNTATQNALNKMLAQGNNQMAE